jgi:hypothetical protein
MAVNLSCQMLTSCSHHLPAQAGEVVSPSTSLFITTKEILSCENHVGVLRPDTPVSDQSDLDGGGS